MTIKLKAEFQPSFRLITDANSIHDFEIALDNHLKQSPAMVAESRVILENNGSLDTSILIQLCQARKMLVWGVYSRISDEPTHSDTLGLPWIAPSQINKSQQGGANHQRQTMVISKPVRSGVQIYARDKNLVVMSQVGAGAEIIADGDIQVWGPLRGRAIAGASGDLNSSIITRDLTAELVSIAGIYRVRDDMPELQGAVRVYLDSDNLVTEQLD